MAVTLVFIGKLADIVGKDVRQVPAPLVWEGLSATLGEDLARSLSDERIKVAVNGAILPDKAALAAKDGDEVAFLPPVSGG